MKPITVTNHSKPVSKFYETITIITVLLVMASHNWHHFRALSITMMRSGKEASVPHSDNVRTLKILCCVNLSPTTQIKAVNRQLQYRA